MVHILIQEFCGPIYEYMKKGKVILFICLSLMTFISVHAQRADSLRLLNKQAKKWINTGNTDSALNIYATCISMIDSTKVDSLSAAILLNAGRLNNASLQHEKAVYYLQYASSQFLQLEIWDRLAYTKISQSECYRSMKEFNLAVDLIDQAENIISQHDNIQKATLAYYYNRKAAVISETRPNTDSTLYYSNQVLKIAREIGDKEQEAASLNEIGFIYSNEGFDSKCLGFYNDALILWKELGNSKDRDRIRTLINISRYYIHYGDFKTAHKYMNAAKELSKDKEWAALKSELYYLSSIVYAVENDYKNAYDEQAKHSFFEVKRVENLSNKNVQELVTKYDVQSKEQKFLEERKAKETARKEAKNKTKQRNFTLIALLITALLMIAVIRFYLKIRKVNKQLDETNNELGDTISQKDALYKEMHHRVKNNMQMVSSLLELQNARVDDPEIKKTLESGSERINALSLAHQLLYEKDQLALVNLSIYINSLIDRLVDPEQYEIHFQSDDLSIHVEKAQSIGVIINELITNSIKYAWPTDLEDEKKTIQITLKLSSNKDVTLNYKDAGQGYPEGFSFSDNLSLGSTLIQSFVTRQLQGTIKTHNQNGACAEIKFNLDFKPHV